METKYEYGFFYLPGPHEIKFCDMHEEEYNEYKMSRDYWCIYKDFLRKKRYLKVV